MVRFVQEQFGFLIVQNQKIVQLFGHNGRPIFNSQFDAWSLKKNTSNFAIESQTVQTNLDVVRGSQIIGRFLQKFTNNVHVIVLIGVAYKFFQHAHQILTERFPGFALSKTDH